MIFEDAAGDDLALGIGTIGGDHSQLYQTIIEEDGIARLNIGGQSGIAGRNNGLVAFDLVGGERKAIAESLRAGAWLLGLLGQDPQSWFSKATAAAAKDDIDPDEIDALVERRLMLRSQKQFDEADEIRDDLVKRGILIEDGPDGSRWRRAR